VPARHGKKKQGTCAQLVPVLAHSQAMNGSMTVFGTEDGVYRVKDGISGEAAFEKKTSTTGLQVTAADQDFRGLRTRASFQRSKLRG